jgi:hypothetical protein
MSGAKDAFRRRLSSEMQMYLAYRDYLQSVANHQHNPVHRPYCRCKSAWKPEECRRDPSCVYPEDDAAVRLSGNLASGGEFNA